MNTIATLPLDVFESAETVPGFENHLRAELPLWAQNSVTTALLPTGFSCGLRYTAEDLANCVKNEFPLSVISDPDGHTFVVKLTENEDDVNFHGFIVALKHGDAVHELKVDLHIPVRLFFGGRHGDDVCVKFNEGRLMLRSIFPM